MISIKAKYFTPHSSRAIFVDVEFYENAKVLIRFADDSTDEYNFYDMHISSRVGNTYRIIELQNGIVLHSNENDDIDDAIKMITKKSSFIHLLESNYKYALLSFLLLVGFVVFALTIGANWSAKELSKIVPYKYKEIVSNQTLSVLDKFVLKDSNLTKNQKIKVKYIFSQVVGKDKRYRLHFRRGMGINAFALPDGQIVILDELVKFCKDDPDMIYGVLAHEKGHVELNHSMQLMIKSSIVGTIVGYFTGDFSSSVTSFATAILNSSYSKKYESQADIYAKKLMLSHHKDPKHLALFLEKISKKYGEENTSSFLSSHPSSKERIKALLLK